MREEKLQSLLKCKKKKNEKNKTKHERPSQRQCSVCPFWAAVESGIDCVDIKGSFERGRNHENIYICSWIQVTFALHLFNNFYFNLDQRAHLSFLRLAKVCLQHATKGLPSLLTEFICISSATVTRQGAVCPLTSQLTSCIACLTIIACIPYYTILVDFFAFASSGTPVAVTSPCRVVQVYNGALFRAPIQRWR